MTALYPPLPSPAQSGGQIAPLVFWGVRVAVIMAHVLRTAAAVEAADRPTTTLVGGFCLGLAGLRLLHDGEIAPAWGRGSYTVARCISPPGGRFKAEIICLSEIVNYLTEAGGMLAGKSVGPEYHLDAARKLLLRASKRVQTLSSVYLDDNCVNEPLRGASRLLCPSWRARLDVTPRDVWESADA